MKTKVLCVLLIITINPLFMNCSSNDSDGCATISCQNGGVFVNCQCDCAEGYTGNICSTEVPPSRVIIEKAIVKVFPNNDNGADWDAAIPNPEDSLPDIYITFQDSDLNVIYDSPTFYENVLSGGGTFYEFDITPNLEITNYDDPYLINIWDYDPTGSDDFMTNYGFFAYTSSNNFPDLITVVSQANDILVDLEVGYEW